MSFFERTAPVLWNIPKPLKSCIECRREFRSSHKISQGCHHCNHLDEGYTTELMACNEAYTRYGSLSQKCEQIMTNTAVLSDKERFLENINYSPHYGFNPFIEYDVNLQYNRIVPESLKTDRSDCQNWFGLGSKKCSRKNRNSWFFSY